MGLTLILSGCGETTKKVRDPNVKVVKSDTFKDAYKFVPPVTVTTFRFYGPQVKFQKGEDIDNNVWTRAYEKYCGIKLKSDFSVQDFTQFDLKVTTSIATNSLPDIIPIYTTLFFRVADAGLAMDLTKVYNDYLEPDLKTMMEKANSGITYKTCKRNGILAAVASSSRPGPSMMWIRQDWLDKLGQKWPKTIYEAIDIMKLFHQKNAGAPAAPETFAFPITSRISTGFENAFGAYKDIWIDDGNGGIMRGDVSPKWKPVLQKLSDMYNDNQLDTSFSLSNQSLIDSQMTAQQFGFDFDKGSAPDGALYNSINTNKNAVWKSGFIPDVNGKPAKMAVDTRVGGFTCVNRDSLYPEAVMLLANIYGDLITGIGIEYRQYHDFLAPDGVNYDSFFYPLIAMIYPPIDNTKVIAAAIKSGKNEKYPNLTGEQLGLFDKFKNWTEKKETYGWRLWACVYPGGSAYTQNWIIDNNYLYPDRGWGPETPTWIKKGPDLFNKSNIDFTQIVRGDKTVDEGFAAWVKYFNDNGGQVATQEMNVWWKAEGEASFKLFKNGYK